MRTWLLCMAFMTFSLPAFADEQDEARIKKTEGKEEDGASGSNYSDVATSDGRIRTLVYDASDIYTIPTRFGYQTQIEFSSSEEIQTISVGDRSQWQLIPAGFRLFIRPMGEDMSTNMSIITNKRSYQFDLKAGNAETKKKDIIYVARFVYPAPAPKQAEAPPSPSPGSVPFATGASSYAAAPTPPPPSSPPPETAAPRTNFNYTYTGPEDAAPYQVYDDGARTFIKFRSMPKSGPEIVAIGPNGMEVPVRYTVQKDMIVIERIAPEFIMKTRDASVHIYNEAFGGR